MALGGGTWVTQNKILPGSYVNFTSAARASAALSDRGVAAAPFVLDWGPEGEVRAVTASEFQKDCKKLFGYPYSHPAMLALREIFLHATKVYTYRLGTGGVQAYNKYAKAKYPGTRGNALSIVVSANVDEPEKHDVATMLDGEQVDLQTVAEAGELVANDYVTFEPGAELEDTAGEPLTSGANAEEIEAEEHSKFLAKIEPYAYNVLCCPASDAAVVKLYAAFTKRMRDEVGAKFQLVAWESDADYEGVIGIWNTATHSTIAEVDEHALVYWTAGMHAAVAVNASLTNTRYDGELTVNTDYTQADLEAAIQAGKFMFHNVNGEVRVLEDINTLLSLTDTKGEVFQSNQTVRVCDQIANDIAVIFNNRYLGKVPNDASGRCSLWGDAVALIRQLESIRAVENFDEKTVTCSQGEKKKSVLLTIDGLNIINAMTQLYMSVVIQ